MSELFSIKNANIKKIHIKKLGDIKELGVRKLGIWGIIFLFGICAFISGFNINSYAASSSTILPI
ncbi:MAG: hypothetical protein LBT91_03180, partial [Bifidobacteriaceae bacterium]|nr:hypothetical protein [Bifidobacteriaceae bacterium]